MLDFDLVQSALERLGATADAAESHGTLCALLIDNATCATWLGHTLEELPDTGDVSASEQLGLLQQLYAETRAQFNDEELTFDLLLPDEAEDFGLRLLGLSGWCQGFLYGFGVFKAGVEGSLDEQARECLSDLLEISKLSHDEEPSEDSERQYVEIVEHVRIVTLMLNELLNPLKSSSSIH